MDIHIFWEGPHSLDELVGLNDSNKDFGVYQVYGHHPLYGNSVLLYIGLTIGQTFASRVPQEQWLNRPDHGNTQIYVGRLAGKNKIAKDELEELIKRAEKLLIFAHRPAFNTQNTKSIPEEDVKNDRIYNWYSHRDLFPEVSGNRFTDKFDHIVGEHIYNLSRVL